MSELCLMASRGYPPGPFLHPADYFPARFSKDFKFFLSNFGINQDLQKFCFDQRMRQMEWPVKPKHRMVEDNDFFPTHSNMIRPLLIDAQDFPPNLIFEFGSAESYVSHDRALKLLLSRSSDVEQDAKELSKLFDLMGLQAAAMHTPQQTLLALHQQPFLDAESQASLISPITESLSEKRIFVEDFGDGYFSRLPEDQLSLTGSWNEMKDILGTLSEVYSSNNTMNWKKQAMLVPYFDRRIRKAAQTNSQGSSSKEPVKSSVRVKYKKTESNTKAGRDLYRSNPLRACESLLSIMVDKKRYGKDTINSLKRSGPEIPKLLTQFSASIAGTGLAVLFSVVCKLACSKAPLCASKLLSTGLGLGLVWLSSAVNKLRDTVISINKTSGKLGVADEEMTSNLERNVREIYLRAVTIMAFAVLRFV